jgi:hypothetical protein
LYRIAFFEDENLGIPYNTRAYDLKTGKADNSRPPLPDDKLVNEVWVAVAGRVPTSALRADSELNGDPNFFNGSGQVLDIVMSCPYQAFDVEYTWFNSTVQDVHLQNSPNGTISEVYHGHLLPTSVSGTNPRLLDILAQAAMQSNITEFCRTWASLFSGEVMSIVGGVTSPRSNILQQDRTPRIVAKIWIPSLVWLVLCCLMYAVAGVVLAMLAIETSRARHIQNAVSKLSISGLAEQGFLTQHEDSVGGTSTGGAIEGDTIRVGFGDNFTFKKWNMEARSAAHASGIGVD